MFFKLLIFFHFISVLGMVTTPEEHKVKAWIELEGELDSMSIRAKIANSSSDNLALNYVIETYTRDRVKKKETLQRGKCISPKQSVVSLSESRMNLRRTDELCVQIKILRDNKLVAVDSVVFRGIR